MALSDRPPSSSNWAHGTVITGTGFFGHHRQHIRSIVQSSGGTYSGDLLEDYTTHLVYKDLAAARRGEKYTTALAWGIPVLPFSWLEQSLAQQRLLPANCQTSTETMTALASPATKLHMLSLQTEPELKGAAHKQADKAESLMLEPSNSQATCRLTQDAQSRAGSNPVHHSASLQEAEPTQQESQQQLQQLSQQDLAVHNQQQQGQQLEHQHQQLQYTKPTEMQQHQQSLSSDSLLNSKRDQQAGSPAACKLEDQPKQAMESPPDNTCTSLAPTALKGNMVDIQAEVIIPDLHPDDMVVANRTIPAQLPAPDLPALQVQQDLTSSDTAGEAATAATSCISSASASLQHSAAASNSGSETDVSVVPDSQVMNEDDWAPAPAAEQPHSQLVTGHGGTQQQQIAEDGYSHAFWASADFSSEDRACSSSEPLYTASPSAVAAESPSRQQQAAGFATERPAVTELTTASSVTEMPTAGSDVRQTTPSSEIKQTLASVSAEQSTVCSVSRQTAAACQQASSSHMPDVTEQHLPQPQQLQHVQSQSASSSSCVSPSTTCATSALVIDDSDSDSDFQTAQPFRFMSDRQANQHQAAAAAPLGDAPFTDPTASKQAALQPSTANLQCRQQQSGKTGIHALKLMLRAPRGTTVKQAHSLSSLKGVRFAELLQVNDVLLNTKDKKACVLLDLSIHNSKQENCCELLEVCGSSDGHTESVIAEIQAVYQVPSGDWWVEYSAFYTVAGMQAAARDGCGKQLLLPSGTHFEKELFHGISKQHARIAAVQGTVTVRKNRQVGSISKRSLNGYFWRASFDEEQLQIVTDRPVTDFVQ